MTLSDRERSFSATEHFFKANISKNTAYIAYVTNDDNRLGDEIFYRVNRVPALWHEC